MSLALYQDDSEKYAPVINGELDALTTMTLGSIGTITTRMISSFFYDSSPTEVTIYGEVILAFAASNDRSLRKRTADFVSEHSEFEMKVALDSSLDDSSTEDKDDSE